jgi:hypothetical protein
LKEEKFEDIKGVIRSRKWKKERQYKNVRKGQIMVYKTLYRKLIISNSTKRGLAQVPRREKQFMIYMWHTSC